MDEPESPKRFRKPDNEKKQMSSKTTIEIKHMAPELSKPYLRDSLKTKTIKVTNKELIKDGITLSTQGHNPLFLKKNSILTPNKSKKSNFLEKFEEKKKYKDEENISIKTNNTNIKINNNDISNISRSGEPRKSNLKQSNTNNNSIGEISVNNSNKKASKMLLFDVTNTPNKSNNVIIQMNTKDSKKSQQTRNSNTRKDSEAINKDNKSERKSIKGVKKIFEKNLEKIFSHEEMLEVKKIISIENNEELKQNFDKLKNCSKEEESPLIKKIKHTVLKHKENNSNLFLILIDHLKESYKIFNYHFIELFIYFNDFFEDNIMPKKNFVDALISILQQTRKENLSYSVHAEKDIVKDLFRHLNAGKKFLSLESLTNFLKEICKSSLDLNMQNLFQFIDKEEKEYFDNDNLEVFLSPLIDFIESNSEYSEAEGVNEELVTQIVGLFFVKKQKIIYKEEFIHQMLRNKGVIMIRDLMSKAENIIRKKIKSQIDESVEYQDNSIIKHNRDLKMGNNWGNNDIDNHKINFLPCKNDDSSVINESVLDKEINTDSGKVIEIKNSDNVVSPDSNKNRNDIIVHTNNICNEDNNSGNCTDSEEGYNNDNNDENDFNLGIKPTFNFEETEEDDSKNNSSKNSKTTNTNIIYNDKGSNHIYNNNVENGYDSENSDHSYKNNNNIIFKTSRTSKENSSITDSKNNDSVRYNNSKGFGLNLIPNNAYNSNNSYTSSSMNDKILENQVSSSDIDVNTNTIEESPDNRLLVEAELSNNDNELIKCDSNNNFSDSQQKQYDINNKNALSSKDDSDSESRNDSKISNSSGDIENSKNISNSYTESTINDKKKSNKIISKNNTKKITKDNDPKQSKKSNVSVKPNKNDSNKDNNKEILIPITVSNKIPTKKNANKNKNQKEKSDQLQNNTNNENSKTKNESKKSNKKLSAKELYSNFAAFNLDTNFTNLKGTDFNMNIINNSINSNKNNNDFTIIDKKNTDKLKQTPINNLHSQFYYNSMYNEFQNNEDNNFINYNKNLNTEEEINESRYFLENTDHNISNNYLNIIDDNEDTPKFESIYQMESNNFISNMNNNLNNYNSMNQSFFSISNNNNYEYNHNSFKKDSSKQVSLNGSNNNTLVNLNSNNNNTNNTIKDNKGNFSNFYKGSEHNSSKQLDNINLISFVKEKTSSFYSPIYKNNKEENINKQETFGKGIFNKETSPNSINNESYFLTLKNINQEDNLTLSGKNVNTNTNTNNPVTKNNTKSFFYDMNNSTHSVNNTNNINNAFNSNKMNNMNTANYSHQTENFYELFNQKMSNSVFRCVSFFHMSTLNLISLDDLVYEFNNKIIPYITCLNKEEDNDSNYSNKIINIKELEEILLNIVISYNGDINVYTKHDGIKLLLKEIVTLNKDLLQLSVNSISKSLNSCFNKDSIIDINIVLGVFFYCFKDSLSSKLISLFKLTSISNKKAVFNFLIGFICLSTNIQKFIFLHNANYNSGSNIYSVNNYTSLDFKIIVENLIQYFETEMLILKSEFISNISGLNSNIESGNKANQFENEISNSNKSNDASNEKNDNINVVNRNYNSNETNIVNLKSHIIENNSFNTHNNNFNVNEENNIISSTRKSLNNTNNTNNSYNNIKMENYSSNNDSPRRKDESSVNNSMLNSTLKNNNSLSMNSPTSPLTRKDKNYFSSMSYNNEKVNNNNNLNSNIKSNRKEYNNPLKINLNVFENVNKENYYGEVLLEIFMWLISSINFTDSDNEENNYSKNNINTSNNNTTNNNNNALTCFNDSQVFSYTIYFKVEKQKEKKIITPINKCSSTQSVHNLIKTSFCNTNNKLNNSQANTISNISSFKYSHKKLNSVFNILLKETNIVEKEDYNNPNSINNKKNDVDSKKEIKSVNNNNINNKSHEADINIYDNICNEIIECFKISKEKIDILQTVNINNLFELLEDYSSLELINKSSLIEMLSYLFKIISTENKIYFSAIEVRRILNINIYMHYFFLIEK